MTLTQAVVLAKKLISQHKDLKSWNVVLNRRKRAFGVCSYTKKQIQLSSKIIKNMEKNHDPP
jgi:hypothetical protein